VSWASFQILEIKKFNVDSAMYVQFTHEVIIIIIIKDIYIAQDR